MKNRWLCGLLAGVLVCATGAWAQVSTSGLTGTVMDKTGAVVAGAKVTAKNEATGVINETKTTEAGTYAFSSLPLGSYTVTVEMPGFQKWVSTKNPVNVGADTVVNASLEVGAVTSVVEVESTFERLATSNAAIGGVVGHKEITELPLNGRNPLNLLTLEPGLVQRTTNSAGSGTHVYGSRDRAHNVTIDGIDANESSVPNPQSNLYRLTPDNVQEYRVTTHNATPEFGRNSGANVTIATRSGTNDFHGDAFWFHRNTIFNSNEFFNNASGQVRPILLLHQYGGDVGGPIVKNKTHFFFSYQGNRIKQTQPISQSFGIPIVYTGSARNGQFRYLRGCINLTNQALCSSSPSDPGNIRQNSFLLVDSTGNLKSGVPVCSPPAVATNCVDTYDLTGKDPAGIGPDPLTSGLITSLPRPNYFQVGDGLNTGGFLWNTPSRFKGPFFMVRVDHQLDSNNSIFGRMLWNEYNTSEGDLLNSRPSVYPGFNPLGEVFRTGQNLALSWRRVISPQIVNEFTTGYSRFNFFFSLNESNKVTGALAAIGQQCFGSSSFGNINTPYCNTPHTQRAVSNIQFIDNLSYTKGAHLFRGGFNIRMYRHNDSRGVPGGFNMSPTIIFSQSIRPPTSNTAPGFAAGFPGAPGINSNDNGRFQQWIVEMVGIPARVQQAFQADLAGNAFTKTLFVLGTRMKQFDFYVQDEWKIRRNLTFTYGLRWEWNLPGKDCCDRVFVPDRKVDTWSPTSPVTFVKSSSWWGRDNANAFAPRVSLAWQPFASGKTVVRSGWGIAFDTVSTFQVTAIGGKVPGSTLQCNIDVNAGPSTSCLAGSPPVGIDISNNLRVGALYAAFNPFSLPTPTNAPSTQFKPAPQPSGVAPSVGAFDPNMKVPTVHQWDLTIQQELPKGFTVEVGYVGRRGMRLYRAYDLNQIKTNQTGLMAEFLAAQRNIFICQNNFDPLNPTSPVTSPCGAAQAAAGISASSITGDNFANFGLSGQQPMPILAALFGSGSTSAGLSSSQWRGTNATFVLRNGFGDLNNRIDTQSGTGLITLRTNPATGLPFPADYFRPNPQFSQIFYFDSGGSSSYHGMVVNVRRRFERGLTMNFSYTMSKSIDDMSVDPVAATSGGGLSTTNSRTPTDVKNFKLDRSRSDFDNKHVIVANALYELPFGKGRRWGGNVREAFNQFIGGWTITGIFMFQSGEPFTINSGSRTVHNTKQSRAEIRGPMIQPHLQQLSGIQGPSVWNVGQLITTNTDPNFNCRNVLTSTGASTSTFFCIPAPGTSGSGRNVAQGPHFWNFDFGVLKNFTITERVRLQFRSEFFNILNHANFENPRNASVGSPTITSSVFGQTCCVSAAIASSATVIALGEPNRVIQFGFKVMF